MFHRVKSDVPVTAGQKNTQEADKGVAQEETRQPTNRQDYRTSVSMSKKEERPEGLSYRNNKPKTREETNSMRQSDNASAENSEATSPIRGGYQPSVARSSNYAGGSSYAATSGSTYSAPPAVDNYTGNDRTLTIGRGINMSGEIDACDHLMVEGTVEAALKGAKLLEIAECGTFYGTVEIEEATIAGRFEGDITVNGRLTIKSTGIITGSIAYRELEVEAGALLDGRMTPLKIAADPKSADKYRAGSDASAMAKAKELISKKDNREPANTENSLFSKARAPYL